MKKDPANNNKNIESGDTLTLNKPFKGSGVGIILVLFLNFIGLMIASFKGDEKCKDSAIKTFLISLAVGGILIILGFLVFILIQAIQTASIF